jgi:hypothetical protein
LAEKNGNLPVESGEDGDFLLTPRGFPPFLDDPELVILDYRLQKLKANLTFA